jgi:organic hydroperoxide reductase OsmC/OhrA
MASVRAKRFEFAASVDRGGRVLAEGEAPVELPERWLPEHLLLVAVARCTLKSLRFHARETAVTASASASCVVTRREADDLYAIVEVAIDFDVVLDPEPDGESLGQLLAKAERDCFVGNSLAVEPRYSWRVNGRSTVRA